MSSDVIHPESSSPAKAPELLGERLPLVGRREELDLLDGALARATEYLSPQVVVLQGDRGVGKTRLVQAWAESLAGRPKPPVVCWARAKVGDGDRALFTRLLRSRFGLAEDVEAEEAQATLRAACQEVFEDRRMAEILHFLGTFLNIQVAENPFLRLLEEDPVEHEKIATTVLRRFLEADSRRAPLVLLLDDLHQADDASLDLIQQIGGALEGAGIVLLAVSQPQLRSRRPGWGVDEADVTEITLGPLPETDAEAFLRLALRRAGDLPPPFVRRAVEMTGGNPAFLQELIRLLAENMVLDTSRERWTLDVERFASIELPLSVEGAIEARIMALQVEERQVLELAATVGNVFWFGSLVVLSRLLIEEEVRTVWRSDEVADRLREIVDRLVEREYIIPMPDSWLPGEEEYLFQHNLEYEIIAATSDAERATRNHAYVAQWAESRLRTPTDEHFEFLGQQYEAAGGLRRSAFCFIRAGDLAREKFANDRAIRNYQKGLSLLDATSVLARMDALHSLGAILVLVGRHDEALDSFEEMLHLAWLLDALPKGGAALSRIGRVFRDQGRYDEALERLQAAQALFKRAGDRRGLASTLDDIGRVHWLRGEYADALALHRRTLEMRRRVGEDRSTAFTLSNLGAALRDSGQFKEALRAFEESLALRRSIDDRAGVVESIREVGEVFEELEDRNRARTLYEEGLSMARQIGDRLQQGWIGVRLGRCLFASNDLDGAVGAIDESAEIARQLGEDRLRSESLRFRGMILVEQGELEEGRDVLLESLGVAREAGYRAQIGAAERALAALAARRGFAHEAEERFEEAMSIFSEMGNPLEVARCCDAMARFYESTGGSEKVARFRESAASIRRKLRAAAGREEAVEPEEP